MSKGMDIVKGICTVEEIYEEFGGNRQWPSWTEQAAWRAHHDAGRQAVDKLVADHGATYRDHPGSNHYLRFCGVNTSCTSGHWGLLQNWLAAARRKLPA